jgi:hypothetical protein
MYDRFDDFSDDISYLTDSYEFPNCFECPYYFRQFPPKLPHIGMPHIGMPHGGPPSPGTAQGEPPGPPPSITPVKTEQQMGVKAVSPGSIKPCTYRYVYIWLTNGRSFWAWLTRVDKRSASGFRWDGRRWTYFGVDLRTIEYFECY